MTVLLADDDLTTDLFSVSMNRGIERGLMLAVMDWDTALNSINFVHQEPMI
jgi:hypothetical protein